MTQCSFHFGAFFFGAGKVHLLCKRIPLKIVYAWPPSIAPLQCKGLNTSASVMGNCASFAERLLLIYRWTPFPATSGRDPPNRGPQPNQFRPLPFSRCWIPFPAVAAEIPQKGALQLDLNVASISASCFFLWRRESALLLCKRIPLKIVYAWPASVAPLQCKGLNLTSASVMGNWTASIAERLLLIPLDPFSSHEDPPKRGPPPHQFRPLPFSRCWTPFPAVSGRDPPKRGAADLNVASISASTCFFLWRRESALRIPLKIVYAWPASIAPLLQGLELDLRSVMGNWTASFAERFTAGPLFQP